MYSCGTCTGFLYNVLFYFNLIIFVLIVLTLFARTVRLCNRDMIILVFILKSPISFYINECKKKSFTYTMYEKKHCNKH